MYDHSDFECNVLTAAENARCHGFTGTYLALLQVLKALRDDPNYPHAKLLSETTGLNGESAH